jgi:preprotein translocase subunit SecG
MDDGIMIFLQRLLWVLGVAWMLITLIVLAVHALDGWREWQVRCQKRQDRRNGFEVLPVRNSHDTDARQT